MIRVEQPAHVLLTAAEGLTWQEVPVIRSLMLLRGFDPKGLTATSPVLDWFRSHGFRQLGRTDYEVLFAAVQPTGRGSHPWIPTTVASFRDHDAPGCIRIAFSFSVTDGFLRTETRVQATDEVARRRFAVYWLLIRTWSGMIRRVWLNAISARTRRPG